CSAFAPRARQPGGERALDRFRLLRGLPREHVAGPALLAAAGDRLVAEEGVRLVAPGGTGQVPRQDGTGHPLLAPRPQHAAVVGRPQRPLDAEGPPAPVAAARLDAAAALEH